MKSIGPTVRPADLRTAKAPPKVADPYYLSVDWKRLRHDCLKRDGFRCVFCGKPAIIADHIISRRDGGKDELSNLRSACRSCDNKIKEGPDGTRRGG